MEVGATTQDGAAINGGVRSALEKVRTTAQVVLVIASLYYVAATLWQGFSDIHASRITINPVFFFLSVLFTTVCVFLGAFQWSFLLRIAGVQITMKAGMRIHLLSIMPKYLPGVGWQYLGKVLLSEGSGVPRRLAIICTACEVGFTLIAGVLASLIVLPLANVSPNPLSDLSSAAILWPSSFFFLLAVPKLFNKIFGSGLTKRTEAMRVEMSYLNLLLLLGLMVFTWIVFGVAFFLLSGSAEQIVVSEIPKYILILTLSFLISLVTFFVPLGIGVREGAMTFLLSIWLPGPFPALVAVVSRIVLIVAELLGFVIGTRL